MNISLPVASHIEGVEFAILGKDEIEALSVKRIYSDQTLDRLLHPVPGGLYDPALGAWGDYNCSTCHLSDFACPGHPGHIQLAIPVYHPSFMDQLMKLLGGQCCCCYRFKLDRTELHRYACKFRLLRYGLIPEAYQLDLVTIERHGLRDTAPEGDLSAEELDDGEKVNALVARRDRFVRQAFKRAGGKKKFASSASQPKVESVFSARQALIKEFLIAIKKPITCATCKGGSSQLRKDGFNKIFRLPLGPNARQSNKKNGVKEVEPSITRAEDAKSQKSLKRKRKEMEIDEAISMEADDLSETATESDEQMNGDADDANVLDSIAMTENRKKKGEDEAHEQVLLTTTMVLARLEELFKEEAHIMNLLYDTKGRSEAQGAPSADMFFIFSLLVTPNKYRPDMKTGSGEITESEQNKLYKNILTQSGLFTRYKDEVFGGEQGTTNWHRSEALLRRAQIGLQDAVNSLIDTDRNPTVRGANVQPPEGIKQKLERKEGLFRMNMMGKRVNFAARSVISPDPNIEPNEIGVPPVFARKLTYPEPVTEHNYKELMEAVKRGPNVWPGAHAIENEMGQVINLKLKSEVERIALANLLLAKSSNTVNGSRPKKVHRHLGNGDLVIMNRQPSLHKPSMMCHRARVLPGEKTIRMHYANCNTYNADFDGDEMNMHFPQNESARAEALYIANTENQYLSATAGKPLRGLIQDHLSNAVWLCSRDTFFDREDYHQLLYSCLRPEDGHTVEENIQTVPPAIFKPRPLWTGKQLITTVLKNITPGEYPGLTLVSKSQVPEDRWYKGSGEGKVIFHKGEFCSGVLDKPQLGPGKGGFVHSVYETCGPAVAGKLLGVVGRLLMKYLHIKAFSCGFEDIAFTPEGNALRREKMKGALDGGDRIAVKYVTGDDVSRDEVRNRLEDVLRDTHKQTALDTLYTKENAQLSTDITSSCLPDGLRKSFPKNQMQTMTASGAKGSVVNANLISCNLGQQVLEGRRVPVMVSGKTLPAFKPFDTSIRAGGYITDRFLTGVQPQEYYFHTMGGREGLIDTAVKTSRSGYLQRCIVKGMEGLQAQYDASVRDSDGSMIQFLYGEDGLDITKQTALTDFSFQAENWQAFLAMMNAGEGTTPEYSEEAHDYTEGAMRMVRRTGEIAAADPGTALFPPGSTWGSVSESFAKGVKEYIKSNPDNIINKSGDPGTVNKRLFRWLMHLRYMQAVIQPGEPVGIVVGQSIGEPSTQMTLNTFHLAGHAAKNVTLGIPRLREIVMTASAAIATPTMTLHLIEDLPEGQGARFAKAISRLTLAEVIDEVEVNDSIGKGNDHDEARLYDVRFKFFPSKDYCDMYAIREEDVSRSIELKLLPLLAKAVRKELKDKGKIATLESKSQPKVGKSSGRNEEAREKVAKGDKDDLDPGEVEQSRTDDIGSEEEDDDEDAMEQKANRGGANYDADEEDKQIAATQRRDSEEPASEDEDADLDSKVPEDEGYGGSESSDGEDGDAGEQDSMNVKVSKKLAEAREERLQRKSFHVTKFKWDVKRGAWCELRFEYDVKTAKILLLPLVEAACRNAVVQDISGIGACTLTKEEVPDPTTNTKIEIPVVLTEGVNLGAMHDQQHIINPHRLFTNDIVAMLNTYGVEACRATIIREMDAVFSGHSISVDVRHLNLIADMMTRGGGFAAFSRTGMKSGTSPLAKMSFETTIGFLKDAIMDGDWDDLSGPSARIVVGKTGRVGTGAFDVLMPVA